MKLLVIYGSDRKGNTYRASQSFINKLRAKVDEKLEIEEIWASKLDLGPCLSCHQCFMQGELKCPHNNVVHHIQEKIIAANGVIIASPTYAMHVPGALKNLIDHLAYNFHRPTCSHVQGFALATTAGAGAKTVSKYLKKTFQYFGFNSSMDLALALRSEHYEETDKIGQKLEKVAEQFARRLVEPPKRIDFFTTLNFHMWQAMNEVGVMSQVDQEYWEDNNLLSGGFYSDRKAHVLGKAIGKILGKLISS